MKTVSETWFSGGFSSVEPAAPGPFCVTSMRASCVHTAVIRRNEMQHDNRSMNGTRLIEASSGFLPPLPLGTGAAPPMVTSSRESQWVALRRLRALHRVAVADDQVHDLHRNL